ncbi:helix-turn-helix domain-containing protein [Bacillus toyonensis]|uniref:helix-turn-helix domain-containing protein n=1 Tax=Bacillus toyonensis TaxID=155322 RepID=UPI000BF27F42|nr:helix-turn-helix domain-containing protein [Bacillus toyonensis]PGD05951.1 transcriptional regulator [Bacillus toyonensis]
MKRTLGEVIKDYRFTNKLSLRDFAQKCDVSHTYIDKLEKGIDSRTGKPVEPTLLVIEKISKAMNKKTKTLLEEIGFINGEGIEADVEKDMINNPELGLWFKDIKDASPEKREELKQFWEFIMQNEKYRKGNDKKR